MLLTGSGLEYSPEFIQYMDANNLWGDQGYPDCRLVPQTSGQTASSLTPSDALLPFSPDKPPLPKGATAADTSSYALGTMTWNVIFVSTIPDVPAPEVWKLDPAAIPPVDEFAPVKSAVNDAKTFWEAQTANYVPGAQLKINVKYLTDYGYSRDDIAVDWYPVADKSEVWMNDVMAQVHLPGVDGSYNSSDRFQNVLDCDNDTRILNNTNWSVTVFYLHDANELANGAPYPGYGYAYLGGPCTVITQDFAPAVVHEMGHIFNALDEYHNSGAAWHDFGGYLWYQNLNCQDEPAGSLRPVTVPWPDAMMLDNYPYLSPPSKHMVGHWDSDYDNIPDILDTLPTVTANTTGSNTATGTLTVSGTFDVTALPDMLGGTAHTGITIATITSAFYRLNGGEEVFIDPSDGAYDGYSEAFSVTLNGLMRGTYAIDVYTVNSVGNVSAPAHFTFSSTLTGPDLVISKTHTGNFTQGETNDAYTITVTNAGTDGSTTSGLVNVVDTLPAGMSAVGMSGSGWTVDLSNPAKPKATRRDWRWLRTPAIRR